MRIKVYVTILLFCFFQTTAIAEVNDDDVVVNNLINSFCDSQFRGDLRIWEESYNYITFSPKRKLKEQKNDPEFEGRMLTILGDKLIVVTRYKIEAIEIDKNKAIAKVLYRIVANTKGEGDLYRTFVPITKNEIMIFNLEKTNKGWRIIDPPPPLVSKPKLIEVYDGTIKVMDKFINKPNISKAQKKQYLKYLSDVKVLKELSD